MIEAIIRNYLAENLSVPVYMEIPPDITTEQFVVIEKVGLRRTDFVNTASIAFQSYSLNRMADAAKLDEDVRHTVEQMAELAVLGGVRLESSNNKTDTRTKWYRYQSIYGITFIERSESDG